MSLKLCMLALAEYSLPLVVVQLEVVVTASNNKVVVFGTAADKQGSHGGDSRPFASKY